MKLTLRHFVPFCPIAVASLVLSCGRNTQGGSPTSTSSSNLIRVSNSYGLDLTNYFQNIQSTSWTYTGTFDRANTEVILLQLRGETARVAPLLQQIRASKLYLSEFNLPPRRDYMAKAPWWTPAKGGSFECARFSKEEPTARSLELFIEDDGTNVCIFAESTMKR